MRLRLDAQAERDLKDIRDYLLGHAGEDAADRVREHFQLRFKLLTQRPQIGIPSSNPRVRILSPTKYPYRIYFTVTRDAVVILHIRHTARRAPEDPTRSE